MTELLYWGVLIVLFGTVWVLSGVLRQYIFMRGSLNARSMLHKERLTAIAKDKELPGADTFPVVSARDSRLRKAYLAKLIAIPGLVLSFGGIGMGIGFLNSARLREWASLSWIPILTGLGLLLYLAIARWYFKEVPR